MKPFKFENTIRLTESEYVNMHSLVSARTPARVIRLVSLAVVGVIFLFSSYTLLLGVGILLLIGIRVKSPRMIAGGLHSTFHGHKYLRDALTYGVSTQKLWARGEKIDASASFKLLVTWSEREGFLILGASGIPAVYLSVAQMKEEGAYEGVKALAMKYGKELRAPRTVI